MVRPARVGSKIYWIVGLLGSVAFGCGPRLVDPQGTPLPATRSGALPAEPTGGPRMVPLQASRGNSIPASELQVVDPTRVQDQYHEVRPGETLGQIARRYGVATQDLQVRNGLDSSEIQAGQQLFIPSRSATQSRSATRTRKNPGD